MNTNHHEVAKQRIKKAFWQIRQRPDLIGLGPLLDRFEDIERRPTIPTCATDGRKFFYNTEFVGGLLQPVLRTVALHEALHNGHSHHLRLRNMFRLAGIDPDALEAGKVPPPVKRRAQAIASRANVAMDHVINNQITQMEAYQTGFLGPFDGWMCDPKYADQTKWSFERVFSDLGGFPPEDPEDEEPPTPGDGEGESAHEDEDGDEIASGGGGEDEDGEDKDEDGEDEQQGDGGGGGEDEQQDDGHQGGAKSEQSDPSTSGPGYDPVGGMGEVLPSPAQTAQEEKEEYQDIMEDLARGEFMEKCMGSGRGTNRVMGTLRDTTAEKPSEWGWMKELLSQAYSDDRTWAKPNLYHMDHGYLPGRDNMSGDLVVWCDLSGSMTEYELGVCRAELEHIAVDLGIKTIYLGYFSGGPIQTSAMAEADTYFTEIEVGSGEPVEFEIVGRGGTDFDPCLKATEDEGIDVQAMVVFTDGEVWIKEKQPDYPVIWATTHVPPDFRDRHFAEAEPWGEVVRLNIDKTAARRW